MWPEKTLALNPTWFFFLLNTLSFNVIFLWDGYIGRAPNSSLWSIWVKLMGIFPSDSTGVGLGSLLCSEEEQHLQQTLKNPIIRSDKPRAGRRHHGGLAYSLWGSVGVTGGCLHCSWGWASGSHPWSSCRAPCRRCSGRAGCPRPAARTPWPPTPATGARGQCSTAWGLRGHTAESQAGGGGFIFYLLFFRQIWG